MRDKWEAPKKYFKLRRSKFTLNHFTAKRRPSKQHHYHSLCALMTTNKRYTFGRKMVVKQACTQAGKQMEKKTKKLIECQHLFHIKSKNIFSFFLKLSRIVSFRFIVFIIIEFYATFRTGVLLLHWNRFLSKNSRILARYVYFHFRMILKIEL